MITVDSLLEIAQKADATYAERSKLFGPGTVDDERNDARELREKALACAAWMETSGVKEALCVGPFGHFLPARGERVLIKKGATICTTKPGVEREGVVSRRDQVVVVHSADRGWVDFGASRHRGGADTVRAGRVSWAGAGGYWRWTDLANVEKISE